VSQQGGLRPALFFFAVRHPPSHRSPVAESAAVPLTFFRRHAGAMGAALIVIATLLAYANTFDVPFYFDDVAITDNPSIRDLTQLGQVLSPPSNVGLRGRPIANLSFAMNYAVGGLEVRGYHAANLAIHLAAALTLFALVRHTLTATPGPNRSGSREACAGFPRNAHAFRDESANASSLAALVALLWSLHPLATAAVTYLSQRTESLIAFFVLFTLYAFARGWRGAAVVTSALAILTKETAVTTPLLVLLYDRTFVAGSFRTAWVQRAKFYGVLAAATWLPLAWTLRELKGHSVGYAFGVSASDYALTSCRAIVTYLGLAFWPSPLVFDYGREVLVKNIGEAALPIVLVAALLFLGLRELRRGSALGAALAGFFLLLAPTTSIMPIAMQPFAENRMYLPLAIVVATVAVAAYGFLGRRALIAGAIAALAFGALTFRRNADYDNPRDLWSDTVEKRPGNARAHHNLGLALAGRDDALAVQHFRRAIEIDPQFAEPHNDLGLVLAPAEAVEHFRTAVRLQPRFFAAWANLGNALLELGRNDEASAAYETALALRPTAADANYNLGNLHFHAGRFEAAIACYRAALAVEPDSSPTRTNLGIALLRLGRAAEARTAFETVLRHEPDYALAKQALDSLR
jgi:protein O-mannosyl-transferase